MNATGTYVYCLVAAPRRPRLGRVPSGLPGMGPIRVVDVSDGEWLVVSDAPLGRYGEQVINAKLSDLEWVSRAAVAHEAVVEAFIGAPAVLPMKLFTIFRNDDRAVEYVRRERRRIDVVLKRVANHQEWGVRVVLDRARALAAAARPGRAGAASKRTVAGGASGLAYLTRKKALRDQNAELAERARDTVAGLYDRLAGQARLAKKRSASELPIEGGPLLLDAAFLVPSSRRVRFRTSAAREAKALQAHGYAVTLTGPWPPYSFVQD